MLILLPGLEGTGALFAPLVDALGDGIECRTHSYPNDTSNAYNALFPLVYTTLPRDRSYVLLGWSFSGPLAIMTAARRPPGLRGLILCSTFARSPHPYVPELAVRLLGPMAGRVFPFASLWKARLGGYATSDVRRLLEHALIQTTPDAVSLRLRAALSVDVRPHLARVEVPVLYLQSSTDFVVPPWCVRALRTHLRDLRVQRIAGPHPSLLTNPAASAACIRPFVRECLNGKS